MNREMPQSLRRELEWALRLLCDQGTPNLDVLDQVRRAIGANSPMLHKRFAGLVDSAAPLTLEEEDRRRLGALLAALDRRAAGERWSLYRPEPDWDETATEVVRIRIQPSLKSRLQMEADRSGVGMSELIRRAVDEYLAPEPETYIEPAPEPE